MCEYVQVCVLWACLVLVGLLLRARARACVRVCTWFGFPGGLVHRWRTDLEEAKEAFQVCV